MTRQNRIRICPSRTYGVNTGDVKYCEEFGTKLIAKCPSPSCEEKIRTETARYCFKCGHSLRPGVNGPSPAEQQ